MEAWKLGATIEGKYRLGELLARGGQGEVYAAEHVHTGERVAVKCMAASVAGQPELVERMLHEARVTAALRHPNHVAIRDCNVVDGRVYIVMELLEGRDCRAMLADNGPMPIGQALYIVSEAASGITAAHEKWVVHRDLKPENIFVCTDDCVKVIDYGTSKSQSGGRWITQDGLIAGTLAYMPPERLAGAIGDERVDMFALGMILMELVLGRHPFAKGPLSWPSEAKLRKLMRQWNPEALTGIRESVPGVVWELFAKATARDPDGRFTNMAEFRDRLRVAMQKAALAAFLPSEETPVRPVAAVPVRGSEKTFAARVLEQTPVMRPAVQPELAADTPVVTPIRYAALQQERELAKRSSAASTGVRRAAGGLNRGALSEPVEIPMIRIGTRTRITMSLIAMAAGFTALVRSSFVIDPVRAGQELRADVSMSSGTSPRPEISVTAEAMKPGRVATTAGTAGDRSPMASVQTALMADEASTTMLMELVAHAEVPAEDTSVRSRAKATAKKKARILDIGHVASGLDGPELETAPARTKRSELPKPVRKLAENNDSFRLSTWE